LRKLASGFWPFTGEAALFYALLPLLRRTHTRFIVNAIGGLLVLYAMARFFNLYLTSLLFPTLSNAIREKFDKDNRLVRQTGGGL
jgi:hypothetical protein